MMTTYEKQSAKLGIVSTGRFGALNDQVAVDGGPAMVYFVARNLTVIAWPGETVPAKHYLEIDREDLTIRVEMPDGTMSSDHAISLEDQRKILKGTFE